MSKYTPGPWQWFETEAGEARVNPVAGGLLVAKCDTRNPFDDEQRANARLIASAPELLDALREAELVLAEKLRRLGADPNVSAAYQKIGVVIAKATGKHF